MNTGKDFSRNVNSFYGSAGGFTANVSLTYSTLLTGGLNITNNSASVTGTNSLFVTQLVVGDYVYYYDTTGAQQIAKIATISTNQTLTFIPAAPALGAL